MKDAIRGSLVGGAAGDALGYEVEFWSERQIFLTYGKAGITEYALDPDSKKAIVSDDTQMTLFTANGILVAETLGDVDNLRVYVKEAYVDWLLTQKYTMQEVKEKKDVHSWLLNVPELFARRAPGNTCLMALSTDNSKNNSKGCGGVMRVAPLALRYGRNCKDKELLRLDYESAQLAAITHGHSLGYMPAAVLNHIISRILSSKSTMSLKEIVLESKEAVKEIFAKDVHLDELTTLIDLAVSLSENDKEDLDNIHELGEGWVGEEALAIAIYCALKYQDDFSKGVCVAVNHKGDSDSTGAVFGNIAGAWIGYEAMEEKWKKDLEMMDVILEMAEDLGKPVGEDEEWKRKYVEINYK